MVGLFFVFIFDSKEIRLNKKNYDNDNTKWLILFVQRIGKLRTDGTVLKKFVLKRQKANDFCSIPRQTGHQWFSGFFYIENTVKYI